MAEAWMAQRRVHPPERDQPPREGEQLLVLLRNGVPVDPADLIVLAIGVVVAVLGAAELVARQQERRAVREHQRRQHVALLALAQLNDRGVVGRPLDAVVPAIVGVVTVLAVLAVGLVVLVVVGGPVVQREAVV